MRFFTGKRSCKQRSLFTPLDGRRGLSYSLGASAPFLPCFVGLSTQGLSFLRSVSSALKVMLLDLLRGKPVGSSMPLLNLLPLTCFSQSPCLLLGKLLSSSSSHMTQASTPIFSLWLEQCVVSQHAFRKSWGVCHVLTAFSYANPLLEVLCVQTAPLGKPLSNGVFLPSPNRTGAKKFTFHYLLKYCSPR